MHRVLDTTEHFSEEMCLEKPKFVKKNYWTGAMAAGT